MKLLFAAVAAACLVAPAVGQDCISLERGISNLQSNGMEIIDVYPVPNSQAEVVVFVNPGDGIETPRVIGAIWDNGCFTEQVFVAGEFEAEVGA